LKLHAQAPGDTNAITGYGPGYVEVNRIRYMGAVLLSADAPVRAWDVAAVDTLEPAHFEALLALRPEVVLLGTGDRQRFPAAGLASILAQAGIGLEVMDTGAACRTFNILVGEGRRVVGALLATGESTAPQGHRG
jgi:uncharacterized protein